MHVDDLDLSTCQKLCFPRFRPLDTFAAVSRLATVWDYIHPSCFIRTDRERERERERERDEEFAASWNSLTNSRIERNETLGWDAGLILLDGISDGSEARDTWSVTDSGIYVFVGAEIGEKSLFNLLSRTSRTSCPKIAILSFSFKYTCFNTT